MAFTVFSDNRDEHLLWVMAEKSLGDVESDRKLKSLSKIAKQSRVNSLYVIFMSSACPGKTNNDSSLALRKSFLSIFMKKFAFEKLPFEKSWKNNNFVQFTNV